MAASSTSRAARESSSPLPIRLGAALGAMRWSDWAQALGIAILTYIVLGIPSDIVPNPIFGRPIPVRAIDHVILVASALVTGLIFGLRAPDGIEGVARDPDMSESGERRLLAGGVLTFFAVGCPVCNRFVVSLIGTSGALNWFRPVQPVLGALALGLLWIALRRRLADLADPSCAIPSA